MFGLVVLNLSSDYQATKNSLHRTCLGFSPDATKCLSINRKNTDPKRKSK